MSKPSASGRRRSTVWIEGQGWTYIPDVRYHRHNLGGGNPQGRDQDAADQPLGVV